MKLVLKCLGCQETYEASEQIRYFLNSHSMDESEISDGFILKVKGKENWRFAHIPYERSHVHGHCGKTGQREVQLQQ